MAAGFFFFGIPWLVAMVIVYVKFDHGEGTWLESHFRWQISTFWWALLWLLVGAPLVFVYVGVLVWAADVAWVIYRIVKGFLYLVHNKPLAFHQRHALGMSKEERLKRLAATLYTFHATGLFIGIPSLLAAVISSLKIGDAHGTWLESHFRLQVDLVWWAGLAFATEILFVILFWWQLLFGTGRGLIAVAVLCLLACIGVDIQVGRRIARGRRLLDRSQPVT